MLILFKTLFQVQLFHEPYKSRLENFSSKLAIKACLTFQYGNSNSVFG